MKSFAAQCAIHSDAETVWRLLTDASGYPSWNSTVLSVSGTIAKGNRIVLRARVSPDRDFTLKVEAFEPNKRMTWVAGAPFGLFRGERTYSLSQAGDRLTEFSMVEQFSGPMSGMITKALPNLQPEFDQFAADLKARAESVQNERAQS